MVYSEEYFNLEVSFTSSNHMADKQYSIDGTGNWEFYNYSDKILDDDSTKPWTKKWYLIETMWGHNLIESCKDNQYEECHKKFHELLSEFKPIIEKEMKFLNLEKDWKYIINRY